MISAENVFKSYNGGKTEVLKDVNLEIESGEFAVILGASGSGKSTLLSLLSGLERPDSGKIVCCNEVISEMNERALTEFRRRKVGFIFQQYYLLPHLNAEGNVRLGAALSKNENYKEVIKELGLENKMKCRSSDLSGGEQQRVCIARALAKSPEILFADEPTGALDENTGRETLDFILKSREKYKFTLVMVTHNGNIAETADKVILMNSGRITECYRNSVPKSVYEIGW